VKVGRLNEKRERIYRCIVRNTEALLRNEMLVEHVMSETLIRLDRSLPRDDVRGVMTTEHVHHVLVCDKAGVLLGVISDRDFQKTEAGTAEQLMTGNPIVAKRHDPLELAISTMIQHHISCLPVIDESGVLAGILTSSDLLLTLQCAFHLFERLNSSGAVGATSG
jgi:acetoin utilization protein AcuB